MRNRRHVVTIAGLVGLALTGLSTAPAVGAAVAGPARSAATAGSPTTLVTLPAHTSLRGDTAGSVGGATLLAVWWGDQDGHTVLHGCLTRRLVRARKSMSCTPTKSLTLGPAGTSVSYPMITSAGGGRFGFLDTNATWQVASLSSRTHGWSALSQGAVPAGFTTPPAMAAPTITLPKVGTVTATAPIRAVHVLEDDYVNPALADHFNTSYVVMAAVAGQGWGELNGIVDATTTHALGDLGQRGAKDCDDRFDLLPDGVCRTTTGLLSSYAVTRGGKLVASSAALPVTSTLASITETTIGGSGNAIDAADDFYDTYGETLVTVGVGRPGVYVDAFQTSSTYDSCGSRHSSSSSAYSPHDCSDGNIKGVSAGSGPGLVLAGKIDAAPAAILVSGAGQASVLAAIPASHGSTSLVLQPIVLHPTS